MNTLNLGELENQLIGNIYEAAVDPKHWPQVLQGICNLCSADQCTLFFYDAHCRSRNYATAARVDMDTINIYLRDFIDLQAAELQGQLKPVAEGKVVTPKDINRLTGNDYEKAVGESYMQKIWPNLALHAGIVLLRNKSICAGLGVQKFHGALALPQETLTLLERLSPHLVQAMHIHNQLSYAHQLQDAMQETINRVNSGIILLDKNLRIVLANLEAARILDKTENLNVNRLGQLCVAQEEQCHELNMFIDQLKNMSSQQKNDFTLRLTFALNSKNFSSPLKISILPMTTNTNHLLGDDSVHLALLINDAERQCQMPNEYLQQAYSLTLRECNLIQELINGGNLPSIAEKGNIKLDTVRWQLKNIMNKTSTRSQAELSRLMMALCEDSV